MLLGHLQRDVPLEAQLLEPQVRAKPILAQHRRQHDLHRDPAVLDAHTVARPAAERHIGERMPGRHALRRKVLRIELIGALAPQIATAMHIVVAQNHQTAGGHDAVAQLRGRRALARQKRADRQQAHRLAHAHLQVVQLADQLQRGRRRGAVVHTLQFVDAALLDVGVHGQHEDDVGDGQRGGLVALLGVLV